MTVPTFSQWLAERGARTALGIYPPAYGTFNYPPLAQTPHAATAALALTTIHGGEHPELLKPEYRGLGWKGKKKGKKHKKKHKKGKKTHNEAIIGMPTQTASMTPNNPALQQATQQAPQQGRVPTQQQQQLATELQPLNQIMSKVPGEIFKIPDIPLRQKVDGYYKTFLKGMNDLQGQPVQNATNPPTPQATPTVHP